MEAREEFERPSLNLLGFQIRVLQAMAMWPIDLRSYLPRPLHFVSSFLWRLFRIFSILLALHIGLLHLKTAYDYLGGNLDDLADISTVSLVYLFCFFAVVYVHSRHELLRDTIDLMNNSFRKRSAKGLTFVTIDKSCYFERRFAIYWVALCVAGAALWGLYPLTVSGRNLPLKCWYPFDEKQPYVFEFLYFIQFIGQLQLGMAFPSGSYLYVPQIMLVCGQYDSLFCSLKNFIYTAELETKGPTKYIRAAQEHHDFSNEEVNQYYCSEEKYENLARVPTKQHLNGGYGTRIVMNQALRAVLKDCVVHHQIILQVCKNMEKFFSPLCLVKTLQVMFQLCFMAFYVVNAEATIFRMINFGQYFSLTLIELTLFTYYGEVLFRHSLRVSEALARSDWYLESIAVSQDISIIMSNAMTPVKLTSGKMSAMDIEKWGMVLKSAFSFFTLLQNLK